MPICFNKKVAFIHIPKTGGQTINYLFSFFKKKECFFGEFNDVFDLKSNKLKEIVFDNKYLDAMEKSICFGYSRFLTPFIVFIIVDSSLCAGIRTVSSGYGDTANILGKGRHRRCDCRRRRLSFVVNCGVLSDCI